MPTTLTTTSPSFLTCPTTQVVQGGGAAGGGSGQGFDARFKRGGGDQMRITGFMNRVDCIICGTRLDRMAR